MAQTTQTTQTTLTTDRVAKLAKLPTAELSGLAAESARDMARAAGRFVLLTGELDRRQGWRVDGATSLENWIVEHAGVSLTTARALAHVAERLFDLPHLAGALSEGELSFDKVRAVADVATPETDRDLTSQAAEHSVRDLIELARSTRPPDRRTDASDHDARAVRFNDSFRTMTAQLPAASYAELRSAVEARAKQVPSDGELRWDQRMADGLMSIVHVTTTPTAPSTTVPGPGFGAGSSRRNPYAIVAHVPLEVLLDEDVELAGELERHGLISADTVRRLACDATLMIGVDDAGGRTMYEGRAKRFATDTQRREIMRRDRHCRFPGCTNVLFSIPHHVLLWKPDRGPTDIDNLALLCDHHHALVHSKQWTMTGNANEELRFVGPSGRVMTTRPSPLWTRVTSPHARAGLKRNAKKG